MALEAFIFGRDLSEGIFAQTLDATDCIPLPRCHDRYGRELLLLCDKRGVGVLYAHEPVELPEEEDMMDDAYAIPMETLVTIDPGELRTRRVYGGNDHEPEVLVVRNIGDVWVDQGLRLPKAWAAGHPSKDSSPTFLSRN